MTRQGKKDSSAGLVDTSVCSTSVCRVHQMEWAAAESLQDSPVDRMLR